MRIGIISTLVIMTMMMMMMIGLNNLPPVYADTELARKTFYTHPNRKNVYHLVAKELIKDNLYYAALPFLKSALRRTGSKGKKARLLSDLVEYLIPRIGLRPFESIPLVHLKHILTPAFQYITGKYYFRQGKFVQAHNVLKKIPQSHPLSPYALFVRAASYNLQKQNNRALETYKLCYQSSQFHMKSLGPSLEARVMERNRDYCLVGQARSLYALKKYDRAASSYLDLQKESVIWPEILFEEAWNAYNRKNYNRTLGKLVTYKAPLIRRIIFNPEIDVLRALTYYRLCLMDDAQQEIEDFYKNYSKGFRRYTQLMERFGENNSLYFSLAQSLYKGGLTRSPFVKRVAGGIMRDPKAKRMFESYQRGLRELKFVKELKLKGDFPKYTLKSAPKLPRFKKILINNVLKSLAVQRSLIGSYLRRQMMIKSHQMEMAFQHLSYIKLEILAETKRKLISGAPQDKKRTRGDIQYLSRTKKQYFWTFNGEFWADELGDYVFALASECKK